MQHKLLSQVNRRGAAPDDEPDLFQSSTLMDKQINPRAGFLLSQNKNESHIELHKWAIYFIQPV